MKWILATERMPSKGGCYHLKTHHFEDDPNVFSGCHQPLLTLWDRPTPAFGFDLDEGYTLIAWLDESEQLPSGVPSDEEIQKLAFKLGL